MAKIVPPPPRDGRVDRAFDLGGKTTTVGAPSFAFLFFAKGGYPTADAMCGAGAGHKSHSIGSIVPALAKNARAGHPQFRNGKRCEPQSLGHPSYSGDLQTFLYPFSTNEGTTDYEIYWRDLSLAYDVNYYCHFNTIPPPPPYSCNSSSSISLGGEITSSSQLLTFFQAVGQGNDPTACGSNTPQTGSMGDCGYAIKVNDAQGPH
jgi:hypothetical protein